jgi:hypothetical protein
MAHTMRPVKSSLLRFQEGNVNRIRASLSGVALLPDGSLWLVADETTSLERLQPEGNGGFGEHKTFPLTGLLPLPGGPDQEIDTEGLAYVAPYLWLVGSHSLKIRKTDSSQDPDRLKAKHVKSEANRYTLGRIRLDGGAPVEAEAIPVREGGNALTAALRDDPHIGPYVEAGLPGKANGLDVEGLAVRGDRVLLGLRGPVLLQWAIILELQVTQAGRELRLEPIGSHGRPYKKHFVDLGGLGVRDLHWAGGDLLILAGPTMYLDGPSRLYRLAAVHLDAGGLCVPDLLFDLPHGQAQEHAEGVTLFHPVEGRPTLLVVYDAPPASRLVDPGGVLADVFALP